MSKNKLTKFAENRAAPNVVQPEDAFFHECKGKWNQAFFQENQPINLELACGKGEYTVGLARHFPDWNFVGMDIKGARIWKGSQRAMEQGLDNVAFLRSLIHDLDAFFAEDEISEIWIVFPDPRPKKRDIRRRLTNPRFLEMYKKILKKEGWLKLKTDDTQLFDYTLKVLEDQPIHALTYTYDLYDSDLLEEHYGIETFYESRWLAEGRKINYLKFKFT